MKNIAIISFLFLFSTAFSQPSPGRDETNVITLDPRGQRFEYVPGEILIRFNDDARVQSVKTNGLAKTGMRTVDALFEKYQVTSSAKLFKNAKPFGEKQYITTFAGQKIERPSLHNIYKLRIGDEGKMYEAIEALKNDQHVEYAEPNFVFSIVDDKPVSDILTEQDVRKFKAIHQSATTPNDPLYPQQWYIPAINADTVWHDTQGDTSQIIGILDTGVDWLHPDLMNKILIDSAEANGSTGTDDDGNGYIDDIRGWDFINNDNDPSDDNSHGTHVAGIAAAEANNGIGIAGVNWKAKILPVKVFQSSGRGDAATITQGIIYATEKGATVINMSFGSYARSLTMEAALANAYATSVLVAAAGNDGVPIGPPPPPNAKPFYPAAVSYVLGVQAGDAMGPVDFSNYDPSGPVFSNYADLLNYELKAPGVGIISTVPNGAYRSYNGTSMAAPIVSGAVSLYRSLRSLESQEVMWGNLINTSSEHLNLFAALQVQVKPVLWFVSQTLVDTLPGDNSNELVDAGETVELWFTTRNTWGPSDSVFMDLKLGEFEDTSIAHIINPVAFIGSISPYATRTNENHPFMISINPQIANDREIVFDASLRNAGGGDTVHKKIILTVSHGQYLLGIMDSSLVLTPDKFWIVNGSFRVDSQGTLIIRPGTHLKLYSDVPVRGRVQAVGTKDSVITIEGPKNFGGTTLNDNTLFKGVFRYVHFLNNTTPFCSDSVDYCTVENYSEKSLGWGYPLYWGESISNSVFTNCSASLIGGKVHLRNNIVNCYLTGTQYAMGLGLWRFNNFSRMKLLVEWYGNAFFGFGDYLPSGGFVNNYLSFDSPFRICGTYGKAATIQFPNQYWGTTDSSKIRRMYDDFWTDANIPLLNINPILGAPLDSAHGCVWKVLVNGKDAQDEKVDPVGVGSQRFDVYFNRAMDTTAPQISFGVREPFTQQAVSESGYWSEDHKVWTAYKAIKLYTGDGINQIRVAGAKDPEGLEIPIEDKRFKFLIDAAGSASVDFIAQPGLGKIRLEWNNAGLADLLGFNMYRFTNLTDTTYTDTVLINKQLITDTLYTDYDVLPGTKYYYLYKVVRTDFSESDYSKVTNAKALTSSPGDANGDLAVNVLDIISIVSYILTQNPAPFIFEAADVNQDGAVNILDIVGTINIILNTDTTRLAPLAERRSNGQGQAVVRLERGEISLETPVPAAGLQITLAGCQDENVVTRLEGLNGFEVIHGKARGDTVVVIAYSLKGKAWAAGATSLLKIKSGSVRIAGVVAAGVNGNALPVKVFNNGKPLVPEEYILMQNYPNPFNPSTTIMFGLPEDAKEVEIGIYDILGRTVKTIERGEMASGYHQILWDGRTGSGISAASGVYFYRLKATTATTTRFLQARKMLLIR